MVFGLGGLKKSEPLEKCASEGNGVRIYLSPNKQAVDGIKMNVCYV